MIAIVDYGVGNLFSLSSALTRLGLEWRVTARPEELLQADRVLLPGVGAFGDAMGKLKERDLVPVLDEIKESGRPLMGICLGMQLLFEKSSEYGNHKGLGYLLGEVCDLGRDVSLKVPHIGWNSLDLHRPDDPLVRYIRPGDYVYYVHSYYARGCEESLVATSQYGVAVPGLVHRKNVYGSQFHPEKSGRVGLCILKAFSEV